jgi:hypothetical protein
MNRTLRIISIILLLFLAVNAVGGSLYLITDPTGKAIQIPLELLEATPFYNYLIPGIILLLSIGFLSIIVAVMTIKKNNHHPLFIILQGCVLIGWLTVELILNSEFFSPILHYPLYIIGILLIVFGLILKYGGKFDFQR